MAITQDRMIRLLDDAERAIRQVNTIKKIAALYREDPRLAEAKSLAHSTNLPREHPIYRVLDLTSRAIEDLIRRVCEEHLPEDVLLNLTLERRHFDQRRKINDKARQYMRDRRPPSTRQPPRGPNPNFGQNPNPRDLEDPANWRRPDISDETLNRELANIFGQTPK